VFVYADKRLACANEMGHTIVIKSYLGHVRKKDWETLFQTSCLLVSRFFSKYLP